MKNIIIALFLVVGFNSYAQYSYVTYTTGSPIGDYRDFISEHSWKGFEAGFEKELQDNFSMGLSYRYIRFYEKKERETIEFDNGAITSTLYTYSFINNFNLTMTYLHQNESRITPYLNFAVGPTYVRNELIIGFLQLTDHKWRFNLSSALGIRYSLAEDLMLDFKVDYNYMPVQYEKFKSMKYVGFSLGIGWTVFSY